MMHYVTPTAQEVLVPAWLKDIFDERLGVEGVEIVKTLASADKSGWDIEFVLDYHRTATFARSIEFGHDKASEIESFVELPCL